MQDVELADHGTIVVLTMRTREAKAWAKRHLPDECPRLGAYGYAVERRYVGDILGGMMDDGLQIGRDGTPCAQS